MFFNLGLPATAAAAHTHEFSSLRESSMGQEPYFSLPLPCLQAKLQFITGVTYNNAQTVNPPVINGDTITNHENVDDEDTTYGLSSGTGSAATSPTLTKAMRTSIHKTKTIFHLAHPPPTTKHRQRFKVRPKLLLQLHQVSNNRRPRPAFDVLPSAVFVPRLTRKFTWILNGRTGLGPDDIVIVKSQTYDHSHISEGRPDDSSDDEDWDSREIVAAICPPKKRDSELHGQTEIYLGQGPRWIVSPSGSGGYDFVCHDENGRETRARWFLKTSKHRREGSNPKDGSPNSKSDEKQFKFSILMPHTRRHPVVASMDRSAISISDQYSIPENPTIAASPDSSNRLLTIGHSSDASYFHDIDHTTQSTVNTDEQLKTLILATGIWVAFAEGWSDNFKYNVDLGLSKASLGTASPSRARTVSSRLDIDSIESRGPTPQSFTSAKSHHPGMNIMHRSATTINITHQRPLKFNRTHQRSSSSGAASLPSRTGHSFPIKLSSRPSSMENLDSDRVKASSLRHKGASSISTSHGTPSVKESIDEASDVEGDEAEGSVTQVPSLIETHIKPEGLKDAYGVKDAGQGMKRTRSSGTRSKMRRSGTLKRLRSLFGKKGNTT